MGKWRFRSWGALFGAFLVITINGNTDQKPASERLERFTSALLESQGADGSAVALVETTGTSFTVGDMICINSSRNKLGPVEFVLAHEVGHILAGHCQISGEPKEETRAMEKEADLLGAEMLHNLGLDRAIFERIGDLRIYGADCVWEDEDHPSLTENAEYLSEFLIGVGYTQEQIDRFCEEYSKTRCEELRRLYEEENRDQAAAKK